MAEPMTKKQQKAAAFRQKQKAKKSATIDAIPDVPEQDIDDGDEGGEAPTGKDKAGGSGEGSKKRKRDESGKPASGGGAKLADEVKKVVVGKGKGKGKAKSDWEEEGEGETGAEGEKSAKKSKKEIKQRFILFIGNLDYKTTKRDVQNHFKEAVGDTPDVRLLTTKPVPSHHDPRPKPKSRGIAFLELPTSAAMQQCLKLHHSTLQNRTINVELTAGGGGKSDTRKEKIKERNDRVGTQRERKAEKEKEEAGAGGADGQDSKASDANANADGRKDEIIENPDGSKTRIRNGRRVKVNPNGDGNQRFRRDGPGDRRGGGGDRRGGGGGGGNASRGYGKFQPSGANAMMVG